MERFLSADSESRSLSDILDGLDCKRIIQPDGAGPVTLVQKGPPELFSHLELDQGLGHFAHYKSIIDKLDVFERIASEKNGRVACGLVEERVLVAYSACWHPKPGERWSKLGDLMYEMGAIEVSRQYRHLHIGGALFDLLMKDDFFEDHIAYMNGFSWHWDLDGTGLTMTEYRNILMGLIRRYGYKEYLTNEPNISLRPENFFMARVGARVSEEDQGKFRSLRFGMLGR